jgi:hypothetical protein
MAYHHQAPAFSVSVEGAFVAPGLWLVHGEVEYPSRLAPEARSRVGLAARCELLRGIFRESRLGWDRHAERVHVLIEGDAEVAGLFRVVRREDRPARVA